MDDSVNQKKLQSGDCTFHRFFARQGENGLSSDAETIHTKCMRSSSDVALRREDMASASEVSGEEFLRNNGSLLSLQPWIFKRAKCSKREEDSDASVCWSFDWGFSHGSPRRTNHSSNWMNSKKRQDRSNFRPIAPAVEEYTFNYHHLSHVEDDRLACLTPINKERSGTIMDSLVEQLGNRQDKEIGPCRSSEKRECFAETCDLVNKEIGTVIAVPCLPPRKVKKEDMKSREAMSVSRDTSNSRKLGKISEAVGSLDGMLLFLLGIAVGVTSSGLSNKVEVENLKKLLKDNRNLVQDLHDELEMKDLLTVKEIGNQTYGNKELQHYNLDKSIEAFENSKWDFAAPKMDDRVAKDGENLEALSEIEAELEAELERLELNINACGIGQTTSAFIELDSDFTEDVAQGEFREDLLINRGGEYTTDDEDDKEACTSDTTHPRPYNSNYSVSPTELSIRLHRVIENRLEERIKELEGALERCQSKLRLVEAERLSSKPPFSSSDAGSECSKQNDSSLLRSDMAGDALTSYDEAYEEFSRLAETEDEKFLSVGSVRDDMKEQVWEQVVWRTGSYEISGTEEEEEDEDEEEDSFDEGKDLIQRIVEKSKQGSSALLNAQRMLYLMDL